MAVMEGAGGYVDDEIDFDEEVAQPLRGSKKALGKDPGKATRSHMSSAKGHLNHCLKLSGAKYKDYSLIPKDEVEKLLSNSTLFGEFVNYLLTHEDLSLKPRQKKKMAMSSVTNSASVGQLAPRELWRCASDIGNLRRRNHCCNTYVDLAFVYKDYAAC
jgi:hypothetical protein